ncbi:VWA domain-containing protein [Polynucleobacter sp. 71A-WALBACH]|uniref:VIT domain-containing protein n=1 Tax=Polynucleobacter sp. 71A-WALBACH TaxID=2689097 RepID=UPI001C0D1C9D|nr:VIT domain-containing protein [Polynucleobacter sp. 71A-WALBACH]MBU3594597.1 VWA domain-containing protein [Polynucleobacter sp. 71A-WALBACH]
MIVFEKVKNVFSSNKKLVLQSVSATGVANGLLLDMTIRQHYKNNTNKTLEVVYSFPMAWGATFMGMQAEIDGQRLVGTVIEKAKATEQYEKAIADGDAPIMIEKNSDGLYTANLGNLKPNEDVVIEYSYSQLLKYEQGSMRISIPTVIAPRYGDAKKGGIEDHQSAESNFLSEYPFTLSLKLTGGLEKATVECPSHQVQVAKQDEGLLVSIEREAFLDRDFILNLTDLQNQSFYIVTPDKQLGPDGCTVLASFCPPTIDNQKESSLELKILVDCSGSMEGDSIQSAKRALHHVLSHLTAEDRFSYSKFGDHTNHLFSKVKPADQFHISAASLLIENTNADMGGTEVEAALQSTFDLMGAQGMADVLLITDGEVWSTNETIAAAKESGHRIFAVGVGSAPADTLLKELAEMSGGACELISPKEDIEKAIVRMFHRIRQPRACNIEIDWGHPEQPEWTVGTNTAIFSENTTHVFAGFKSTPSKPALLSYQLGNSSQRTGIGASQITHSKSHNLPRLAAAQRIKTAPEGDQIALALSYQLITEKTNCLLVHIRAEDQKATEFPELMTIAQMQAAGWGGAGSVLDGSPHILFSKSKSFTSKCATLNLSSATYASYDMPRVFRSSPITGDSPIPLQESIGGDPDYYDIPAFLRKQATESEQAAPKIKYLDPTDIIEIANTVILSKALFADFVKTMDQSLFDVEVSEVFNSCLKFLSQEQLWTTVLAWLLLHLEESGNWSENTKSVIQELTNEMDAIELGKALRVFNTKMNNIGMHEWLS